MIGNDVVVAKELGYLKKGLEDTEKSVKQINERIDAHMLKEEREARILNQRLGAIVMLIVASMMKDTEMMNSLLKFVL